MLYLVMYSKQSQTVIAALHKTDREGNSEVVALIKLSKMSNNFEEKSENGELKVHKHEICFLTFFAETESLWSQGPVTRDF